MSQTEVRAVLRSSPDGKTASELSQILGKTNSNLKQAINKMPDVYIDRWTRARRGVSKFCPVYMAVEIPENAPKPD